MRAMGTMINTNRVSRSPVKKLLAAGKNNITRGVRRQWIKQSDDNAIDQREKRFNSVFVDIEEIVTE